MVSLSMQLVVQLGPGPVCYVPRLGSAFALDGKIVRQSNELADFDTGGFGQRQDVPAIAFPPQHQPPAPSRCATNPRQGTGSIRRDGRAGWKEDASEHHRVVVDNAEHVSRGDARRFVRPKVHQVSDRGRNGALDLQQVGRLEQRAQLRLIGGRRPSPKSATTARAARRSSRSISFIPLGSRAAQRGVRLEFDQRLTNDGMERFLADLGAKPSEFIPLPPLGRSGPPGVVEQMIDPGYFLPTLPTGLSVAAPDQPPLTTGPR